MPGGRRARRLLSDGCFTPEWSQRRSARRVLAGGRGRRPRPAGAPPVPLRRRRARCGRRAGMLAVSNGGTVHLRRAGTAARALPGPAARVVAGRQPARGRARRLADGRRGRTAPTRCTLVRRLVPGSSRLVPDFVAFTPDGQSIAYDATGAGPKLVPVTGGPSVTLPGLRRVVCRLRALRVRARSARSGVQIRVGNRFGRLVAPARAATGRIRGRASAVVAERPQHPLRHEPPEQRPRALLDPVGRQRAAAR